MAIRLRSCMRPASGRAAAPSVKAGAARILQLSEDEIAEHAMSVLIAGTDFAFV
jgi:hypothetical protein